jgi:uncharacterized metal-binding protein
VPSGHTHDRITLWSLPVVAGLTLGLTGSSRLTLLASSGFLFAGLMFGPDLDIHSRQYQRWGWLRWIWLPYRTLIRHRSVLSHGLLIGTVFRIIYLTAWISLVGFIGWLVITGYSAWSRQALQPWPSLPSTLSNLQQLPWQILYQRYQADAIALFIGLEAGAMSHAISDWLSTYYKKMKRTKT